LLYRLVLPALKISHFVPVQRKKAEGGEAERVKDGGRNGVINLWCKRLGRGHERGGERGRGGRGAFL
jgi:hypothetical protein